MANPQAENGHVDIANEIVEALARYRLSGQEWQVIWVILRKTWGWHKKRDRLSLGYIARMTLMKRPAVARAIKKLVNKGVIKKDNSYINIYMFNKNYETWKTVIKKDTLVSKRVTGVIKKGNKTVIKKDTTTKENTKETIQKKSDIFINAWNDFKEMRKKNNKNKPITLRAEEMILNKLDKLSSNEKGQVDILNESTMNDWKGVFPLKETTKEGEVSYLKYESKKISKEEEEKYKDTAREGIKKLIKKEGVNQ